MMMKSSTIHFRHRIASGNQAPCSHKPTDVLQIIVCCGCFLRFRYWLFYLMTVFHSFGCSSLPILWFFFCVYCFHSFLFEILLPLNTPIEQWTPVKNNVIKLRKCVSTKESLVRYLVISLRTIKEPSACFWLT